jgi:predicted phage terminase large subunit-like protein
MIEKAHEYDPSVILIEDAGVGTSLIDVLRHEGLNAVEVQPTQSKEIRAHIQTPKFQSNRVLFPRSAPWLSELEAEILAFPSRRNDDQVDSITQALAHEYLTIGSGVECL